MRDEEDDEGDGWMEERSSFGEEVARVDDVPVKALGHDLLVLHIERVGHGVCVQGVQALKEL